MAMLYPNLCFNQVHYKGTVLFICTLLHVSGHLIHFEADLAFQNARQTFQGYFYSCQFPNTVYKKLVCNKYHITCFRSSHPF